MRAMSYFSPVARFNDLVGGIALYRTIAELEEHFEEKKQFLMDKLRSLTEKIFVKNRLLISLTADAEGYQLLEEKFPQFLTVLPDGEKEGEAVTFHCEKRMKASWMHPKYSMYPEPEIIYRKDIPIPEHFVS